MMIKKANSVNAQEYACKKNYSFYSGGKLNFTTYASDKYLAWANADEFAERFKARKEQLYVWEFGCGTGIFALNFMDRLQDKHPLVYSHVSYLLFDFSEKFLASAKRKMKHKNVYTFKYEGPGELPLDDVLRKAGSDCFHYVRMNEFWDDLPADVFTLKNGKIYNVEKRKHEDNPAAKEFLNHLPPCSNVVINTGAAMHLWRLSKQFAPSGYIDVFDYGFTEIEPPFETSLNLIRRENEHVTYDINFIYMKAFMKSIGLTGYVEMQDNYVNSVFSGLRAIDLPKGLFYMSLKDIAENIALLERNGYTKEYFESGITEISEFYHMRLWK